MPHNLYLHSSIVQTRAVKRDPASIRSAIGMSRIDTIASLVIAALINMAILILAAAAFTRRATTRSRRSSSRERSR